MEKQTKRKSGAGRPVSTGAGSFPAKSVYFSPAELDYLKTWGGEGVSLTEQIRRLAERAKKFWPNGE